MAKREIGHLQTRLDNTKKQNPCGLTKVRGRFLTLPQMKEQFEEEEREQSEKEKEAADKAKQKEAEVASREEQIRQNAASKVFNAPFTSYKHHGTITELTSTIWAHLNSNANNLKEDPRFAGLFSATQRRRNDPTQVHAGTNQQTTSDRTHTAEATSNSAPAAMVQPAASNANRYTQPGSEHYPQPSSSSSVTVPCSLVAPTYISYSQPSGMAPPSQSYHNTAAWGAPTHHPYPIQGTRGHNLQYIDHRLTSYYQHPSSYSSLS
ncbi:hypothetical protein FA15DRAFT_711971 [Coprinopsis marcescibilis]|uniref:Uncharacterized protein n=1 Tax=Coprinopsis marcescibilis TaxID=230819 RepID=A0A5C3K8F9_COPMA|nr:hypothetical protein FA15DRAFT_711971 [Coprinopsis marcescibilis]